MRTVLVFAAALILASALFAGSSDSGKGITGGWEYKMIDRTVMLPKFNMDDQGKPSATGKAIEDFEAQANKSGEKWEKDLQLAGRDGWELVTVTETKVELAGIESVGTAAYLKRMRH